MLNSLPEYNASVLSHFHAPRNAGAFPADSERLLIGRAGTRRLGREVEFQLRLTSDDSIGDCRYRVYGCPATIALCSLASEALKGRTPAEAAAFSVLALAEQLQLPAEKRDAALVVEDAIRAAAARYNSAAALPPVTSTLRTQV